MASAKNCLINASSSLSLVSKYVITYAFSAFSGTLAGVFSSFFDEPPRIDAYAAAPIVPNTPRTRCSLGIFIPDPVSVADRRQDRMYRRRNTPLDMFVPVRTVSAEMQHVALATITRTLMHARTPTCFLLQHTCNSVRHISSLCACNGRRARISGPSALSSQHPPLPRIDPSTFGRDSQLCCKAPHGPCWSKRPSGSCSHVGWVLRAGHAKFWNCLLCPSAWVVQKPGVIHASAARRAAAPKGREVAAEGRGARKYA